MGHGVTSLSVLLYCPRPRGSFYNSAQLGGGGVGGGGGGPTPPPSPLEPRTPPPKRLGRHRHRIPPPSVKHVLGNTYAFFTLVGCWVRQGGGDGTPAAAVFQPAGLKNQSFRNIFFLIS